MREPSLATWAEIWRLRLHYRLVPVASVKAWADSWIEALDSPPHWLMEAALARSEADALSAVGRCGGDPDESEVWPALMSSWLELLEDDPASADRIAKQLYFASACGERGPSREAAGKMLSFWDGLDLARLDKIGDYESVRGELRAFLARWSSR